MANSKQASTANTLHAAGETLRSWDKQQGSASVPDKEVATKDNAREVSKLRRDMMESTVLRLNNEFGVLQRDEGDTLVYIGSPPRETNEDYKNYQYVKQHFRIPHRVYSRKLKAMQSAKFDVLLGPKSIRTERRLRKEGILDNVDLTGIKYFVDLQPPMEDEEAIVLLTSLTCTKGILTWYTAQETYSLAMMQVGGQDDYSLMPVDFHLPLDEPKVVDGNKLDDGKLKSERLVDGPLPGDPKGFSGSNPKSPVVDQQDRRSASEAPNATTSEASTQRQAAEVITILPEYSPLRHRSAIERLVQAIEHGDPKLDSAPKVWTFFALAQYFGCVSNERISGWIIKWLLAYPNCNFIQVNPEVSYLIGLGTLSVEVTKNAFSILVGEKSLLDVFGESEPFVLSPLVKSVHGRKLELLDDDERNRIDHAAASLVRRMRAKFDDLICEDMAWLQQSSEYKEILDLSLDPSSERASAYKILVTRIKQFVRGRILWVLCRTYDDDFDEFEKPLSKVKSFYPTTLESYHDVYNCLNEHERIFTRFFWIALGREALGAGELNIWTERTEKAGLPQVGKTFLSQKLLDRFLPNGEKLLRVVTKNELCQLFGDINRDAVKAPNSGRKESSPQAGRKAAPRRQDDSITQPKFDANSASTARDQQQHDSAFGINGYEEKLATEERRKLRVTNLVEVANATEIPPIQPTGTTKVPSFEPRPDRSPFQTTPEIQSSLLVPRLYRVPGSLDQASHNVRQTKPASLVRDKIWDQSNTEAFGGDAQSSTNLPVVPETFKIGKNMPESLSRGGKFVEEFRNDSLHQAFPTDEDINFVRSLSSDNARPDLKSHGRVDKGSMFSFRPQLPCADPILDDIGFVLRRICDVMLFPEHTFNGDTQLPVNLIDTLMCLGHDEWKYLPLWAGGNDDGTGGVFDEVDVPNLEVGGFKGGKRGIGNVNLAGSSSSMSGSSFDDISSDAISTVGKASRAATDGTQTVKSLDDDDASDGVNGQAFMSQKELWAQLQQINPKSSTFNVPSRREMLVSSESSAPHDYGNSDFKGKGRAPDVKMNEEEENEIDTETVVGAASSDGDQDMEEEHHEEFVRASAVLPSTDRRTTVKDASDDEDDWSEIDRDTL